MIHYTCDCCGKAMRSVDDVRYEVTIEIKAACNPVEHAEIITAEELDEELHQLIQMIDSVGSDEIVEDMYKNFRFDLCRKCKLSYEKDPLAHRRLFDLALGVGVVPFGQN
ncbi:MAG: hypothetical protein QF752_10365 [Planctomycetota bacterium]|nr:hypothetical protein [Planctomycetota bacterium]